MLGSHSFLKIIRHVVILDINVTAATSVDKTIQKRWLNQGPKRELKIKGKSKVILSPSPRKYTNENTHEDEGKKKKKQETEKKAELKDGMDKGPGWLNSSPNESDLVKHIEVLQRFIDRYNSVPCPATPEKNKPKLTEDGTKTLLKVLDKQPNKKFSTFVRTQKKKSKEIHQKLEERTSRIAPSKSPSKTFITLANEPMTPLTITPKCKPTVPVVKHFINPDSIVFERTLRQLKPRIYSLVNTKNKSKELEAYLKRTIHSGTNNEKVKEKKVPDVTVGEFFTDRYLRKPESEKGDVKSGPNVSSKLQDNISSKLQDNVSSKLQDNVSSKLQDNVSSKLQDSLVEGRRSSSTLTKRSITNPEIHSKTSLLVQKTHLPLTVCKKTKAPSTGQTDKVVVPTTEQKKALPVPPLNLKTEEDKKRSKRNDTIFNKLMKYFKR